MIIEDIPFFAEFVATTILLTFGYAFAKLWFSHSKDKSKIRRTEQKRKESNTLEDEMDKYLDNAGSIAQKIQAELDYLKSKGATSEQLKSLEDKLSLANKVQQYEPLIRIAGKPLIKKILSFVDRV
jgi:Skp family chaperone for outer membrane proteins|tara:strand:+ start:474 stop:851 length:378 start_codon:yes stop_codon:yes gene_type:complete